MDDQDLNKLVKILNDQYNLFSERVDKLEGNMTNLANKTYERTDAVFKEVLNMRDEQFAHLSSHDRVVENIKKLDKRIKKLEAVGVVEEAL